MKILVACEESQAVKDNALRVIMMELSRDFIG